MSSQIIEKKVFNVPLTRTEFATLRSIMTQVPPCVTHEAHAKLYAAILYDTQYKGLTGREWEEQK